MVWCTYMYIPNLRLVCIFFSLCIISLSIIPKRDFVIHITNPLFCSFNMLPLVMTIWLYIIVYLSLASALLQIGGTKKVLIVQNKGGGHGALGYYLAKEFIAHNLEVSLLQDDACDKREMPFCLYQELSASGVQLHYFDKKDAAKALSEYKGCEIVVDNWSKSLVDASTVYQNAVSSLVDGHLLFISSAGMYKPSITSSFPLTETCAVDTSSDIHAVEKFYATTMQEQNWCSTSLRPQYLFGECANTKWLQYFLRHLYHQLHSDTDTNVNTNNANIKQDDIATKSFSKSVSFIPVPWPGDQLVSLTHLSTAAQLIYQLLSTTAATNNHQNQNQNRVFNLNPTRCISYKHLVHMLFDLCDTPLHLRHILLFHHNNHNHNHTNNSDQTKSNNKYNDEDKKDSELLLEAFPFRPYTFVASPRQLRQHLLNDCGNYDNSDTTNANKIPHTKVNEMMMVQRDSTQQLRRDLQNTLTAMRNNFYDHNNNHRDDNDNNSITADTDVQKWQLAGLRMCDRHTASLLSKP